MDLSSDLGLVLHRIMRSLQLDAERVDDELLGVLRDKLSSALSLFGVKGMRTSESYLMMRLIEPKTRN